MFEYAMAELVDGRNYNGKMAGEWLIVAATIPEISGMIEHGSLAKVGAK